MAVERAQTSEENTDIRTTPRLLQLPGMLLLLTLTGYFFLCYTCALGKPKPSWAPRSPYALWPGTWQMFTMLDRRHNDLSAQARFPDSEEWESVDLRSVFPTTWESGYRFSRNSFRKSPSRMRVLASSLCTRLSEAPIEVRFEHTRWKKTLGSYTQPKGNAKAKEVIRWTCDRKVKRPGGVLW